jgi:hypothetical protein
LLFNTASDTFLHAPNFSCSEWNSFTDDKKGPMPIKALLHRTHATTLSYKMHFDGKPSTFVTNSNEQDII